MKKLKIALILAFSMAMTLGLTACASDEYTIERIRFGGSDSITLTDAEAADEKGGTAAFEEAVAELPLRVYADESRNFITGADCSYDVSGITWGAVGNYTATLTPEKNNPDKLSIELNVVIGHDFGEPDENGLAVCKHCGKSESTTTFETPVVLNYDAFHNGPSAESTTDPDGLIKPFGTVDQNGVNVEVPTYSVGKLRKGMTLSVTGTAQSMASEAGSASSNTWFYPVLGFAMREFDPTTMASSYSTAAFSGGASVLVRNDGWLLLNGIGESPRLLAGFAGGAAETYNYGTVPGATLNAAVAGYDPNKMPSSADEWKEWYTYSTGTQLYTLDYQTKQNITLSWEFREDNVIVMTNRNDSMGTSLVSYVRVPDSMADYTFDTVLHGEYINMEFTSISAVESDRLAAATAELAAGAKRTYVEGESLNLDELSVRIAFESAPTAYEYTTDYTVQAYVGSETTAEAAQADTATESWTEVTAETPLSSAWRFFRIRTIVGGSARYAYLNVGYSNFLAEIAPNSVDDVQPVRIVKDGNAYLNEIENMLAYGELTYAAGTANSAAAVSVAITGVPDRIPAAYGVKDYSSFVALRLYAQDGKRFGTPSVGEAQSGYVFATRGGNGAYVDVLVYLNQNVISKGVTLNGIQSTPVFFDLSGLTLPAFSSAVEGVDANGMLPLNKGGDVTVTYTLPGLSIEDARADHGFASLSVGTTTQPLSRSAFAWDEDGDSFTNHNGLGGVPVNGSIAGYEGGTTLTVTYHVPAMPSGNGGYFALGLTYNGVKLTDTVYYGAPVEGEGTVGAVIKIDGTDVWFNANATNIYYVVLGMGDAYANVTDNAVDVPSFEFNVNAGAATTATMISQMRFNAAIGMKDGAVSYDDAAVAGNAAFSGTVSVLGSANMDRDCDRGWVASGAVGATVYGVSGSPNETYSYYFEVIANGVENVYKVTYTPAVYDENSEFVAAAATTLELVTVTGEKTNVVAPTCDTMGVAGVPVKEGEEVVFYAHAQMQPTHLWVRVGGEDGHGGYYRCSECGALYSEAPTNDFAGGFDTGALKDASKNGLTVSFWSKSVSAAGSLSADWAAIAVKTKLGGLNIAMPNLDAWTISEDGLTDAEKELRAKLVGSNLYPAIGATTEEGFTVTPYTGVSAYATIVIDPEEGVIFYVNGERAITYASSAEMGSGTVADFVSLVLSLAERDGVLTTVQNMQSEDLIVQVGALDDAAVATRYQNYLAEKAAYPTVHVWDTDPSDGGDHGYGHCTVCGYLDPDHTHVYNKGQCIVSGCGQVDPSHTEHTYVNGACEVCGKPCSHENVAAVGDVCSVCGGKLVENKTDYTQEQLTAMNVGWGNGSVHYSLYKNSTFTFTAKFASNTNTADWSGFVTRIFTNGKSGESLFFQGNLFILDGIKDDNFAVAAGHVINETLAAFTTDKTGYTWKLTVVWAADDTFTVTLDVWEKDADLSKEPTKSATQYLTVGSAVTNMDLWIGPDAATVESVSTVAQSYEY